MTDLSLSSLYQQVILDHYRKPRNKGEMDDETVEIHMANPVCGDEIKLQLKIEDGRIVEARHQGQGCSISQAAVSMMTNLIKGKELAEAEEVAQRFTAMMHGDEAVAKDKAMGDLRALQGVSKFPVRIKCALLAFDCLQEAVKKSRGGSEGEA